MHKALGVLPLLLLITACQVAVPPAGGSVDLAVSEKQVLPVFRPGCRKARDVIPATPLSTDAGIHQEMPVDVGAGTGDGSFPVEPRFTADHLARNPRELIAALAQAATGEVILVPAGTTLDLNGHSMLEIPGGVTLAGEEGAAIRRTDTPAMPILVTGGDGVRLSGLTFQGPGPETGLARAVRLRHEAEVDLCTFGGWSHCAVHVNAPQKRPLIHHNTFSDCRKPCGYGVEISQGDPLITHNIFDGCRHAVAGQGRSGCSYEAAYNLVLGGVDTNHVFDMHGDLETMDPLRLYTSRYQAGSRILIHHNTVTWDGGPAVGIRGKPMETAHIHNNRFRHAAIDKAVSQSHHIGNLEVYDNELGYFEE